MQNKFVAEEHDDGNRQRCMVAVRYRLASYSHDRIPLAYISLLLFLSQTVEMMWDFPTAKSLPCDPLFVCCNSRIMSHGRRPAPSTPALWLQVRLVESPLMGNARPFCRLLCLVFFRVAQVVSPLFVSIPSCSRALPCLDPASAFRASLSASRTEGILRMPWKRVTIIMRMALPLLCVVFNRRPRDTFNSSTSHSAWFGCETLCQHKPEDHCFHLSPRQGSATTQLIVIFATITCWPMRMSRLFAALTYTYAMNT